MKTKLVVSRKWHQPQIDTFLSRDEVGASIDLQDFLKAVVAHIGNPALLLTSAALEKKLSQASDAVIAEIKHSTVHIV